MRYNSPCKPINALLIGGSHPLMFMLHQNVWAPQSTCITSNIMPATLPKIKEIPSFFNSRAYGGGLCVTRCGSHTVLHARNYQKPCNEHHEPNVANLGTRLLPLLKWASPTDTGLRGSGLTSQPHWFAECWALLSQYGPYTSLGVIIPHTEKDTHTHIKYTLWKFRSAVKSITGRETIRFHEQSVGVKLSFSPETQYWLVVYCLFCLHVLISGTNVSKNRQRYLEDRSTLGQHPLQSAFLASAPPLSADTQSKFQCKIRNPSPLYTRIRHILNAKQCNW